jgi:uncharacterized protein with FMN-binding domain
MMEQPVPEGSPKKKHRWWFWALIGLAILIFVMAAVGGIYAWRFVAGSRNLVVEGIDPATLSEGTYAGTFQFFHVRAEMAVTIEGGRIVAIEPIKAPAGVGNLEGLIQRVLNDQTTAVDIESGATVSQKVILKAIQEALAPSLGG